MMIEKKKFLICFGISTYSRILIMDEPTNGLDIPTKSKFRRLLAGSINENRCFIISTHQARDLSNLIDSIIILDNKEIVFNENLETVSKRLRFQVIKELIADHSIIYSEKINRYYVGVTEDIDWRLERHNLGWGRYTKRGVPWEVVYYEIFSEKSSALKREKEIKNRKSRQYIESLIKNG